MDIKQQKGKFLIMSYVGNLTILQLFGAFFVVGIVLAGGISFYKKIISYLTAYYNKRKGLENKNDLLFKHDNEIKELTQKIDLLTNTVNIFIAETKKDTSLSQRQTLISIYHSVAKKGYITENEAENFDDVLERYEKNGGNGFIHTTVSPYIQQMKITNMRES